MRTSGIVKAINWRYAVGEVLLIVVGILVALAISDWNDRRIERSQELALLEEVHAALVNDVGLLEAKLEETRNALVDMESLALILEESQSYDPAVDGLFGAVYGMRITNLSSAAYENLKSVGLQSVTNRPLRAAIGQVFDHHYQRMEEEHEIEREITMNVLRPYFLAHFVDLEFRENATPIDFGALSTDEYFRNILYYRMEALKRNQLESYPLAIADMRLAIEMLEAEIAR